MEDYDLITKCKAIATQIGGTTSHASIIARSLNKVAICGINELEIYKDKKEHLEKYETNYEQLEEYKECLFKVKYCDTKQKALKVFMNTFYGEMGNKNSSLFQLPLAGGVTSAGQYNLLLIKSYVEQLGHTVYYGDSVIGETPVLVRYDK